MKKNFFIFLLGLVLYGCTAYSHEPTRTTEVGLVNISPSVLLPTHITLSGKSVLLDEYLCWVVASEVPVAMWFSQFSTAGRLPEMRQRLKTYVAVFTIAARSYVLRHTLQGSNLQSAQAYQVAEQTAWRKCAYLPGFQDMVREAIAETRNWVLLDPVIQGDYSQIALGNYARTHVAPAPNGIGKAKDGEQGVPGVYQGSHLALPAEANPFEVYDTGRMGMSQLGLGQLICGYHVSLGTGAPLLLSDPVDRFLHQLYEPQVYLAYYYPNYALAAPGKGIYKLWDIYAQLHGNPAIAKLSIRVLPQDGGEYTVRSGEVEPSNWVFYHEGHDGKLLAALGPEVGVYVDLVPGQYELAVESHDEDGYTAPLRAYLYGESLVGYTRVSKGGTQTTTFEISKPGRYIVAVDVAYFDAPVARRRKYGGTMPPFRVSLTRK